jgi:hypothetical protein
LSETPSPAIQIAPAALHQNVSVAPIPELVQPTAPSVVTLPAPSVASNEAPFLVPDFFSASEAEAARRELLRIAALPESTSKRFEMDFSNTKDLDSVSLAFLHSASQFAVENRVSLRVLNASDDLLKVLRAIQFPSTQIENSESEDKGGR